MARREAAFALALAVGFGLPQASWAVTYFCCQYDQPKCDGVQSPPADLTRAAAACRANGGNPMPGLRCIDRTCAKDFTPSGTFNNPGTKAGVSTERAADGTFTKETRTANGVELQYRISATTSECTKIAVIQMVWYTDEKGKVRRPTEAPNPVPNAPEKDKASTGPGYVIDFADDETTPYYQDNGGGDLTNGDLGRSDGHGGGSPSHISDAPTKLDRGWSKHFESWPVCIEGHDAGEVLAGVTWHLDRNGRAGFDDKNPSKPSQRFKDAVKSWEKYYNDAHPGAPYSEPSGGFKF